MKFDDIINTVNENNYSGFFYTPVIYPKAKSYLFLKPKEIITIHKKDDLDFAFNHIQKFIDKGYFGYSLIKYEAGFLFEPRLEHLIQEDENNLIKFIFFEKDQVQKIKSSRIIFNGTSVSKFRIKDFTLSRSEEQFNNDILKIKNYIKAGDTYQVNYTMKGKFNFSGSHSEFFKKLLFNQSANYSAYINDGDGLILSLSPELFFFKSKNQIESHPMKGTIRRGANLIDDDRVEHELLSSEKNCAENVMIVDLIRNDLGRICNFGSVKVKQLFKVERYESLFQMVSEIKGKLRKKTSLIEILENVFPCGSVTGAPKISTMEIINKIENEKRGIYTGSIGLIEDRKIKLNVAIRTITLDKSTGKGIMGLGSGIVWDSDTKSEYDEVLLKSKFLTEPEDYFDIFETMKFENGKIAFLRDHLARLKSAADYFHFKFNEKKILKILKENISQLNKTKLKKIKLALNKWGYLNITITDLPKCKKDVKVILSQNKILSDDKFRSFKTTNRKLYDKEYTAYSRQGFYEIIYLNQKGNLAEGSRTNIFCRKGSIWFTPPISSGALPGIYRKSMLEQNSGFVEKEITAQELKEFDEIVLTNAIRGKITVHKFFLTPNEFILFRNQNFNESGN